MGQPPGAAFLLGGPSRKTSTDESRLASAKSMVELLRVLNAVLRGKCTFVAIATAGAAFAALVGAAQLSFRLFGPSVRESNALLSAAPQPSGGVNVAFASEAFRMQEGNFAVPVAASSVGLGFSMAMGPASVSGVIALTDKLIETTSVESRRFGPQLLWRVRGVGAVPVSVILMADEG